MASVQLTREQRYDCAFEDCDGYRTASSSVDGSYCSRDCADRATGRHLLADIQQDHRFCWTCLRARKTIERPTDASRRGLGPIIDECLVGFEYPTENVDLGPYGLECRCGSVDHDLPDWGSVRDETPFHWFLTLASEQLVADGRRDTSVDVVTLANELWDGADLELAVGRALGSGDR